MTESLFSSAEVAAAVGLSQVRVNAIALKHGLGARVGAHRVFTQADVEVIRDRRSWWGKRPARVPVPTLYSAAELAARLGVSIATIAALGKSGMGRKVGGVYVFIPEDVVHLEARRESQRPSTNERGQTFYSVSAAAVRLGANREVVQDLAERLDLGRRKGQVNGRGLSGAEIERMRQELREGKTGVSGRPEAHIIKRIRTAHRAPEDWHDVESARPTRQDPRAASTASFPPRPDRDQALASSSSRYAHQPPVSKRSYVTTEKGH